MLIDLTYHRIKYLLKLPPSALAKETNQEEFSDLYNDYMKAAQEAHDAVTAQVFSSPGLQRAMNFDFNFGVKSLEAAEIHLPEKMLLSQINSSLGGVRELQNYIEACGRVALWMEAELSAALHRLTADWQTRALTDTEMAARLQAGGLHPALVSKHRESQRYLDLCKSLATRLQGQWDTLSRQATIAVKAQETGDFLVHTRTQSGKEE